MQVARVAVTEEQWRAFPARGGRAGRLSVSAYLGRLVDTELRRRGQRESRGVETPQGEAGQALAALIDVRAAIDELDAIAGRLARSATAHGGSWDDVASSLERLGAMSPTSDKPRRSARSTAPQFVRSRHGVGARCRIGRLGRHVDAVRPGDRAAFGVDLTWAKDAVVSSGSNTPRHSRPSNPTSPMVPSSNVRRSRKSPMTSTSVTLGRGGVMWAIGPMVDPISA